MCKQKCGATARRRLLWVPLPLCSPAIDASEHSDKIVSTKDRKSDPKDSKYKKSVLEILSLIITIIFNIQSFLVSEDFNGKARNDRRCGPEFPLPDGKPSQCDAESANFCCSKWGFCGSDAEHCDCPTCFNYKLLGK